MPALTRRKDTERQDCWRVFYGDVCVGRISRRTGCPVDVDQWEWSCGFYPILRRGVSAGGTAQSFERAREAFAAAWVKLQSRIEDTDYAENRRQRAWTAWKYAMHDAGLPLPTQLTSGRARCFCGVEIDNKGLGDHVDAIHPEMHAMKFAEARPDAATADGAKMKTFIRCVLVGAILLSRCAWAAESAPVAFAKSVVSERSSQTFATVSYPDESLIVEFRLEPYSPNKATAVQAFGEITKKLTQGAFSKFPKIKSVQVIGNLALRDKRGHDTVDRVVMVKFSKVKAATINWENVDPATIVGIADKHWLLPELSAEKR